MNRLLATGIGIGLLSVGLYAGVGFYATRVAEARVNQVLENMTDVDVEYGDLSVSPLGFDVLIKDVTVKASDPPTDVFIEKIIVREMDDQSEFPTVLDASMQGIKVSADELDQGSLLQQAGYTEPLSLNIDTKYQYQEADGEVNLEKLRVSAEDLGELEMTFKLSDVSFKSDINGQLFLHHAEVVYRDNSFTDRLLEAIATESNQPPQQFKAELNANLTETAQLFITPDNQVATDALAEAITFIENPKGFTISANPQQPLKVDDLISTPNPLDWVEMLNLEIKAH